MTETRPAEPRRDDTRAPKKGDKLPATDRRAPRPGGPEPIMTRASVASPAEHQRGAPPPNRGSRAASFTGSSYNAADHTVEAVFSSGSPVRRYFGTEELAMDDGAVDLQRVASNLCPLLNAHNQWDVGAVLGSVVSARFESGQLVGTIRFADTEPGRAAEGMVSRGELTGISIGYLVRTWQLTEMDDDAGDTWRAVAWELLEVSLVPVPADPNAGVRSAAPSPGTPAAGATTQENDMIRSAAGIPAVAATTIVAATPPADATRATETPAAPVADAGSTRAAEPAGVAAVVGAAPAALAVAAIRAAATNAGLGDPVVIELLERHVDTPFTQETLMADIGRRFAERDSGARTVNRVPATAGAGSVSMARAMEDAIFHRMSPRSELSEAGRAFRGMSLLRMAEEGLSATGVSVRGLSPNEIAERALHTTSDFPALMGNAINRRLRAAYDENQPSYRSWARRAPNAPDFRSINVVQLSAMPDLVKTNEAGEFRYGSATDGVTSYAIATYGRIISISRQLIVNDDLRALERITTGFAGSAARLENRTVYAQLTSNPVMSDGKTLFHADHGNLGTGAIAAASLGNARTKMRLQKGLQNEELNLMPAHLIAPATQEQLAYQFTSSQFVPAKATDVNEFRAGGRTAIEPIVEAVLDTVSTTEWYAAADNAQIDTVEYCYLEGSEGVQTSSRIGFTVDGVEIKASLDFAAAVIDWRGLYKSSGQ